MTSESLFLGIDGGGSHCRGRLRGADGSLLAEAQFGPANSQLGITNAQHQVELVARQCLHTANLDNDALNRLHVGAGIAGLHLDADQSEFLQWKHPFASLKASHDAHIACLGAHLGDDKGGVLILGTGSCGYGLVGGSGVNVGGWGFILSDAASGAHTGYRALRHSLEALDSINEASPLSDDILSQFDYEPEKMVIWAANAQPSDFGVFAIKVVEHAAKHESVAMEMMQICGRQASELLRALRLRGVTKVALMGGFSDYVVPWLQDDVVPLLVTAVADAQDGAIMMAGGTLPRYSLSA